MFEFGLPHTTTIVLNFPVNVFVTIATFSTKQVIYVDRVQMYTIDLEFHTLQLLFIFYRHDLHEVCRKDSQTCACTEQKINMITDDVNGVSVSMVTVHVV